MAKGAVRSAINTIKNATNIDDFMSGVKILRNENISNLSLEYAIKAFQQGNKKDMTMFVFGPTSVGSGKGLLFELEQLAKMRGE